MIVAGRIGRAYLDELEFSSFGVDRVNSSEKKVVRKDGILGRMPALTAWRWAIKCVIARMQKWGRIAQLVRARR